MLEDPNQCCVCGKPVSRVVSGIPVYFCGKCLGEYRDAIERAERWVAYLANAEKQRRKRRNRMLSAGIHIAPVHLTDALYAVLPS